MTRIICIHGAWQGAWAWDRLVPLLADSGIAATALDLPGNGSDDTPAEVVSLELYVRFISTKLNTELGKVWLLAHSGAGVIASQVAEEMPEQVAGIIYVAGIMLPSGGTFAELVAEHAKVDSRAVGISPYLQWSTDRKTSWVPGDAARNIFFHDADPADANWAIGMLTPQAEGGRAVIPTLTSNRFGRTERIYVEAEADRSILLGLQRRMQALLPVTQTIALPTGHCPQLVAPKALSEIIKSVVRRWA
jgi:pimeloyl-ACP methyl ester carboxylesterase